MVQILVFILSVAAVASAFAEDQSWGEIKNGFTHRSRSAPETLRISAIDEVRARDLFALLLRDQSIPFKYPIDGCEARAHAMVKIAEDQGVEMGKVFVSGSLRVQTESERFPVVRWAWHVAPVAFVKKSGGGSELMVFDPSLFPRPVSLEEWKNRMLDAPAGEKAAIRRVYFGGRYQYRPRFMEGYKSDWIPSNLDRAQKTMHRYRPLQDTGATPRDATTHGSGRLKAEK